MSTKKEIDLINREIDRLLDKLEARGLCACCVARGLMYRGAAQHEDATNSAFTLEVIDDIVDIVNTDENAAPAGSTQH